MEKLSVDELSVQLKGHLNTDLIGILKDQKITGSRFMSLTERTLKLFDFNLADILDIMSLISEIKAGVKDIIRKDGNVNHSTVDSLQTQNSSSESDMMELASDKEVESNDDAEEEKGSSDSENQLDNDDDPNADRAEDLLRQYIKPDYLKSLPAYDHLSIRRACSNWLKLQDLKVPAPSRPYLPVPKSALISNPTSPGESSKENSPPKKKKKQDFKPQRKSQRIQLVKPTEPAKRSTNSKEKPGGSRPQLLKPVNMDNNTHGGDEVNDDDEDDEDEDTQETLSTKTMYKLPDDIENMKTAEELSSEKPQIPSFDVEEILLKEEKTKKFVPYLKNGFLFIEKLRKQIFRILVRHVCFKSDIGHPTKFSGIMREGLAKSVVVTYPQFQKLVPVPGQTPWSHIVSHIQNIYKRVLTQLPLEERPRKGKKQKKKQKTSSTSNVDVDLLNVINPVSTNREEILDGMKKSFSLRVENRLKGDSITEMIQKFPHFKNYEGEVLSLEFDLMFPKASDMVRKLTPLIPKVLEKFSAARNLSPKSGLDEMKVFLHLASQLPHSIDKNASSIPLEKEILVILKAGKCVDEFVDNRRSKSTAAVQPYLIAIKGTASNAVLKYFIVLDSVKIDLGNVTFLRAVDWLFKSYHVFNVHYPLSWRNFFRFLQTCMYRVFVGNSDDVIPSAQNLYSSLLSL